MEFVPTFYTLMQKSYGFLWAMTSFAHAALELFLMIYLLQFQQVKSLLMKPVPAAAVVYIGFAASDFVFTSKEKR
jgi:hypothetical protein